MTVALQNSPRTRVWPLTALVVLVGVVVQASALWNALISAAPFFGDVPSRARYLESAASSLSWLAAALAGVALVVVLVVRRRQRRVGA